MKVGNIVALFRYAEIDKVFSPGHILVRDLQSGSYFEINGQELVDKLFNATAVSQQKTVRKTEAEELLLNAGHQPFTVCFSKADGSERVLRGYRTGDAHFGRSLVWDFDVNEMRQVDHRTLKWIILNQTKYIVK